MSSAAGGHSMMPSMHDVFLDSVGVLVDTVNGLSEMKAPKGQTAKGKHEDASYDAGSRSWVGDGGLRYRVPQVDLPGEAHTRTKSRNVRIVLDNVRRLSVNDLLPATEEEKVFWSRYRFLKWQMFLNPFVLSLPFTYAFSKAAFNYLPRLLRGRTLSVLLSASFAELWQDCTFPAHNFLSTALSAKSPLGDAARADWQRLQPHTISPIVFAVYNFRLFISNPMEELAFGGNAASVCEL